MCQDKKEAAYVFVTYAIKTPLMTYKLNTGHFPSTAQGLQVMITKPYNEPGWRGPYFEDSVKLVPLDPWNHPYHYSSPGKHNPTSYDVWSDGPDDIFGITHVIGNW